ncbi:hypothetical protein Mpsy_2426 [Methanolobus psychrophilus R15]|nr:hypothetical protein Mpsy_2426 [Methanolobus psychrophilus R15]
MSKSNQFLKEEDAVSPVIGVILMVAITVILAAVIAAFVFGMGPPEQAPQASIRSTADTVAEKSVVKLQHQGGDAIFMASTNTRITISGNTTNAGNAEFVAGLGEFVAGDSLYVYNSSAGKLSVGNITSVGTPSEGLAASGETINVLIIDVASQQMIADMNVRF